MKLTQKIGLLFLFLAPFYSNCQEDTTSYKFSKITLLSGEIIRPKNIRVEDDKILFQKTNSETGFSEYSEINLDKVEKITVSKKSNTLNGSMFGLATGLVAMGITRAIFEKPKSETVTTSGFDPRTGAHFTSTTTTTIEKTMAPAHNIAIVAGSVLIGTITGSLIKKWVTIYPDKLPSGLKMNFNIEPVTYYKEVGAQINFELKF
jgi:hypothetical protein